MRTNTQQKISIPLKSDYLAQFRKRQEIKKTIPYPSNATYALTRRLIVPRWWVESLLFALGKKHAWYENFLNDRVDQRVFEYFKVSSTNIFPMFFIWHELTKFLFSEENKNSSKIRFDLTPFLRGTPNQNDRVLKTLEENLIKPCKMFDITTVDKQSHKELLILQKGYVNIFRQVSLEQNVNGIWLTLHFAQKLSNLFVAPNAKKLTKFNTNSFVSINPNLFYAMGSRVNIQTALNGLFLEYQKQVRTPNEDFTAFKICSSKVEDFYLQAIKTTKILFDHGMVRGFQNLPEDKISDLQESQTSLNPEEDTPLVFAWNISGQTKEARQFEGLLTKHLYELRTQNLTKPTEQIFKTPPPDELRKIREKHAENIQKVPLRVTQPTPEPKVVPSYDSKPVTTPSNFSVAASTLTPPKPPEPNFHKCTERELSIFVARFYESLNQRQKKMFESERRKMSSEQFRAFMIPILQRTHSRLPT